MAKLFRYPVPAIGVKGSFKLIDPFSSFPGELFECIGVRALTSYISNNEDAKEEIYLANNLTEQDYEEDLKNDVEIVSLQNDKGFVLNIPAKYLSEYPVQDGVYYRGIGFSVFLPAMQAERDYGFVCDRIRETVMSQLGVDSKVEMIETSRVKQISVDEHLATKVSRETKIAQDASPFARIANLERELEIVKQQKQVLEEYIKNLP